MSKIKQIKISNFKSIEEFEADFKGCTAIITGANNSGKTSFLRGIPESNVLTLTPAKCDTRSLKLQTHCSMNQLRVGNFTSSEIVALTTKDRSGKGFGKPAITYILETNMERRLGRSITDEVSARPLSWGKLNERRVHDLLGTDYKLCSTDTIGHPEIEFWKGSPDFIRYFEDADHNTVVDSKCPLTLKSFCQLVDGWEKNGFDGIRDMHKDGEKYYWQLVSNAILTGCKYAELIVYCPYKSELDAIRDMAMQWDGPDQHQYKWIAYSLDDELPYLLEGGHYKNLNRFRFEVPFLDKQTLMEAVKEAGEYLIELPVAIEY